MGPMSKIVDDLEAAATLIKMFCTCEAQPLGLPFVLTAGCLVHDRCVCHEAEQREDVAPGVQFVMWRPGHPSACLWCDSYVALLKVVAALDGETRHGLKVDYIVERNRPR